MNMLPAEVDKQDTSGKVSTITGFIVGTIGFLLCFDPGLTGMALTSLGISGFLFLNASVSNGLVKRYKVYASLIFTEQITSLDSIAARIGKPVDFVKTDLQLMINKKFFSDMYIDICTKEIVLGAQEPTISEQKMMAESAAERVGKAESVCCPGCGASNTKRKGIQNNCEYCGTII